MRDKLPFVDCLRWAWWFVSLVPPLEQQRSWMNEFLDYTENLSDQKNKTPVGLKVSLNYREPPQVRHENGVLCEHKGFIF